MMEKWMINCVFSLVITCIGLIVLIYFFAMCGRQLWLESKLLTVDTLRMISRHGLRLVHLASGAAEHVVSSLDHLGGKQLRFR